MRRKIKNIIESLFSCIFHLYNYEKHQYFNKIGNTIYSFWLKNNFHNCGVDFSTRTPMFLKGAKYISIGDNFSSLENIRFECWDKYRKDIFKPKIIIGNDVTMNKNIHIGCINYIEIGSGCLMGSNILIIDHDHGQSTAEEIISKPSERKLYSKGPVKIGKNVWIGENVSILSNVTIGDNCIIGANSVVTKSFPNNSIIVGSPAKLVKQI